MVSENKDMAAVDGGSAEGVMKGADAGTPGGEKRCYTVEDLQRILLCGRRTVYELLKKKEFSYIKLSGAGYRISKRSFDDWLDRQAG